MSKYNKKTIALLCSTIAFTPSWVFAAKLVDTMSTQKANAIGIQKAAPGVLKASEFIPDQYIVVFKETAVGSGSNYNTGQVTADVAALADTVAVKYGATVDTTWGVAIKGMAVHMTLQQAQNMAKDPAVALIEQDGVMHANASQTPATWGLDRVDQRDLPLNNTYTYTATGAGVTAFVIDTGIRTTHGEFGTRATWGTNTTGDGNNSDCNGHGTHVAGTIGGTDYGVAKAVNLVAVKVLGCTGSGTTSGVISGIDWVTAHKTAKSVANMSLGGGFSASLNTAVTNSIAAGISYGVAAGNDSGVNACTVSPASTPNAITVGATDSGDNRASYSNIGTCLDIFAPGSSITSAWNTSNTATNTLSGTSMATPHVVGVAALYLSTHTATPAQITTALTLGATPNKVVGPGTGSPNRLLYSYANGDTTPPVVNLTSPTGQVNLVGIKPISATATDNVKVNKVEFYVDDILRGTDTVAPYTMNWNTLSVLNGEHVFTATATDTGGNTSTSAAVRATIANTGACSGGSQLVLNSGFESGATDWVTTPAVISNNAGLAHSGTWFAWLNGYGIPHTDDAYQQVTIPANACSAVLKFWMRIITSEKSLTIPYDTLKVNIRNIANVKLTTLATYSNLNKSANYVQKAFDLSAYKGKTIRLQFNGIEDESLHTNFFIDDVTLIERHTPAP